MWHDLCLKTLASRACVWKEGEERRVEREAGRGGGLGKPGTRGSPSQARLGPSAGPRRCRPSSRGPVCGCARPAPPRLQAGASPRGALADRGPDFATESASEGPAGRPGAAPSAGGRSGARGRSGLPSRDLGLCSPIRSGGKIIRRRRRSEFPGCSHSETQAGKLADAWPVPRETRRAPARLFRKVRAPPAGRAGRVPGPRRRAPPRRSSLSGPCPHRQLPGVRRNPFGQNWLGVPI